MRRKRSAQQFNYTYFSLLGISGRYFWNSWVDKTPVPWRNYKAYPIARRWHTSVILSASHVPGPRSLGIYIRETAFVSLIQWFHIFFCKPFKLQCDIPYFVTKKKKKNQEQFLFHSLKVPFLYWVKYLSEANSTICTFFFSNFNRLLYHSPAYRILPAEVWHHLEDPRCIWIHTFRVVSLNTFIVCLH